jgi:DNA polymerase-3 subunit alpha
MRPFVHLHVHSQYSLLDGQASISKLVDKAIADGMPGIALTDHGNMFGVKEFFNYVKKKNSARKDKIKSLQALIERLENGTASEAEIGDLIEFAKAKGGIEYAERTMQEYRQKAIDLLPAGIDEDVRSAIIAYMDAVINRSK